MGQTEATSGCTVEQPSATEVGIGEGGQIKEVVPNPVPQPVEAGAKAADDDMADPKVVEEAEEDVLVKEEAKEDIRANVQ